MKFCEMVEHNQDQSVRFRVILPKVKITRGQKVKIVFVSNNFVQISRRES